MELKDKIILFLSGTIVVFSAYFFQKKELTLDPNRGPSIGKLQELSNVVKQKSVGSLAWLDANQGQELFTNDQIFTHNDSYAQVNLNDELTLNIAPNTLIKLGQNLDGIDLNIQKGLFTVEVHSSSNVQAAAKKLQIKVGDKQIGLEDPSTKIQIQKKKTTAEFFVSTGTATITSKEKSSPQEIHQGTLIKADDKSKSLEIIKEVSAPQYPALNETIYPLEAEEITLNWNNTTSTPASTVIVASDPEFKNIIHTARPVTPSATPAQEEIKLLQKYDPAAKAEDLSAIVQLRPQTKPPELKEILGKNISLHDVRMLLTIAPEIKLRDVKELIEDHPQLSPQELGNMLSYKKNLNLPQLSKFLQENPNPQKLANIFHHSPEATITDLAAINQFSLDEVQIILAANHSASIKIIRNIVSITEKSKQPELKKLLLTHPHLNLLELQQALLKYPTLNLLAINQFLGKHPTTPAEEIYPLANHLNQVDAILTGTPQINLRELRRFLTSNPRADLPTLRATLAHNPELSLAELNELMLIHSHVKLSQIRALLAADSKIKLKDLNTLLSLNPQNRLEDLQEIKMRNPHLKITNLQRFLLQHKDISLPLVKKLLIIHPSLEINNIENLAELKQELVKEEQAKNGAFDTLLATHPQVKQEELTVLQQYAPHLAPQTLNLLLDSHKKINLSELARTLRYNPQIELTDLNNLLTKISLSDFNRILYHRPQTSPQEVKKFFERHPKTKISELQQTVALNPNLALDDIGRIEDANIPLDEFNELLMVTPALNSTSIINLLNNNKELTTSNLLILLKKSPNLDLVATRSTLEHISFEQLSSILSYSPTINLKQLEPLMTSHPIDEIIQLLAHVPQINLQHLHHFLQSNKQIRPNTLIPLISTRPQLSIENLRSFLKDYPEYDLATLSSLLIPRPDLTLEQLRIIVKSKAKPTAKDLQELCAKRPQLNWEHLGILLALVSPNMLGDVKSLLINHPQINPADLATTLRVSSQVDLHTLNSTLTNNPQLDLATLNRQLAQNRNLDISDSAQIKQLIGQQQSIKIKNLDGGSYYWKVKSKKEDKWIESPIASFNVKKDIPPKPIYPSPDLLILTSPDNRQVRLHWEKQQADQYQLELSHINKAGEIIATRRLATTKNYLDVTDLIPHQYAWRIKVNDPKRPHSKWSTLYHFTLQDRPQFDASFPLAGKQLILNDQRSTLNFKWQGTKSALYTISVSPDPQFSKTVFKKVVKGNEFEWKEPLPGKLYWKLELAEPDIQTPQTQSIEVYTSPLKSTETPKDNKLILYKSNQEVTLKWKDMLAPAPTENKSLKMAPPQYIFELSDNAHFTNIIHRQTTTQNQINVKFKEPKEYFWRVRIENANSYQLPSPTTPLHLEKSPLPPPPEIELEIIEQVQEAPKQSSRMQNFRAIASQPLDSTESFIEIKWKPVDYVKGYLLEIYQDNKLKTLVFKKEDSANSQKWYGALPGIYYYRVACIDHWGRTGQFSKTAKLVVDVPKSPAMLLEPQIDGIVIINNDQGMKFLWGTVKHAAHYQVEIASDQKFTKIVHSQKTKKKQPINTSLTVKPYTINKDGYYFWRVKTVFPIGDPTYSTVQRVKMENRMEYDYAVSASVFNFIESFSEETERNGVYLASSAHGSKGNQIGFSGTFTLIGKKKEYGIYNKRFDWDSSLAIKPIIGTKPYSYPVELEFKEKLTSYKHRFWNIDPSLILLYDKSSHLSKITGILTATSNNALLAGAGLSRDWAIWQKKLRSSIELLIPLTASAPPTMSVYPLPSFRLNLEGKLFNLWRQFAAGARLAYTKYTGDSYSFSSTFMALALHYDF